MEAFIAMSDDEIIQYCKENNIAYLAKTKKVYTRKTLLRNIKNFRMSNEEVDIKDDIIDEPKYINEVVWTLEENNDINQNYKQIKDDLNRVIKKCHELLYSSCSIVGTKAQNDIMKLLTVIILKPQFMDDNSELMQKCNKLLEEGIIKIKKEKYEKYILYSKNIKELANTDNPFNEWKMFVSAFLSKILPFIYSEDDSKFNFDSKEEKLFRDIIKELSKINVNDEFIDAFSTSYGDIHEAFRVYSGGKGSKELGQFFTPRKMINAIFNGCGLNDIIKGYEKPTIYDPCMGTAGLLTRAFSNGNVNPNNIYGCETEKDTIKFAECGILITTKQFNNNLIKCDSLCNNPYIFEKKFEIIFTNPPFSTIMNYKDLKVKFNEYKDKYYNNSKINFEDIYPYETNIGTYLFIQLCIYLLNDNGTCAIILPGDGKLNTSTSKGIIKFRKMLCEKVNIIKIINVEKGVFEYTSIKTCVIIFNKKSSTKNIEFMSINKDCNEVKLNGIIPVDKSYSFTFIGKKEEKEYNTTVEIKKLGDVCQFENGKCLNKSLFIEGEYYVIGGGQKPTGNHNQYNTNENVILCSSSGAYAGFISKYDKKVWKSDCFSIIPNETILNNTYLYYYLKYIQDKIYNLQKGNAQPHIYSSDLKELEIPIISLEYQENIIKDINIISKSIDTIKLRISQIKDEARLFMKFYIKDKDSEIKKLGDVCEVNQGTYIKADMKIQGEYPVYGGGNISYYINQYNREDEIIIAKDGVSANCVRYEKNKFFLNHHAWTLICKEGVIKKYLFYYLQFIQDKLFSIAKGSAQLGINQENFYNLEINIPSLEIQEEIVTILENNYKKIEDENIHIETLQKLINNFIAIK